MTEQAPSEKTKTALSYIIHWLISLGVAGFYGALRGQEDVPDLSGGLGLGSALGLLGDELFMPLVGLTDGPTACPPELHVHRWTAPLAYGSAPAAMTQVLHRRG